MNRDLLILESVWKNDGLKIATEIYSLNPQGMSSEDFLKYCTVDKNSTLHTLLSGIQKLFPEVWAAIPEDMGYSAIRGVRSILNLLNIK